MAQTPDLTDEERLRAYFLVIIKNDAPAAIRLPSERLIHLKCGGYRYKRRDGTWMDFDPDQILVMECPNAEQATTRLRP